LNLNLNFLMPRKKKLKSLTRWSRKRKERAETEKRVVGREGRPPNLEKTALE
jgi:hypothetical protein